MWIYLAHVYFLWKSVKQMTFCSINLIAIELLRVHKFILYICRFVFKTTLELPWPLPGCKREMGKWWLLKMQAYPVIRRVMPWLLGRNYPWYKNWLVKSKNYESIKYIFYDEWSSMDKIWIYCLMPSDKLCFPETLQYNYNIV